MTTRNLDPNQISISINGIVAEGYADGSFLEITYDSDQFQDVVGTDGETSRSKSNDLRATVTLRLMATSPTNDLLSALLNADLLADGGAGIGALLITDLQGTSLYQADNCWINKFPDITYERTATERAWTIRCGRLNSFVGGNT